MPLYVEILISVFLVISGVFGFVGSYGLIKLKDSVQRLHAPTKATTLGVGGVLIASMIYFIAKTGHISIHELLITLFLFLTAPITANFIAKAYIARNMREGELPSSGGRYGWAVYDDPPESRPGS
ncbi:Na+/H+ antiporter subunit G [Alphaproteobacteria bacterium GH1-50]|uniref:Na+/H+ antiporter subunit G n=1 Tax=Kangsaoukella pontilimi TaxID=2691042 RepID=A0A7C9MY24_9RHOB|nr:Na+/H+ antiporter subunit G [Kangsaoukella pontilimi]MXQ09540.1 Na+/H+ antiporter subunit G [Kangsaoukella pontilimi]